MKTKKETPKPFFARTAPQTPLEIALKGKLYQHHVWCNASRRKPIGSAGSGCICLRTLGDTS